MIRILFAHPDQKLSQIYTRHIQNHFMVDSVNDGLAALRKIRTSRPSLVVSEYHLPLISGISLLNFVRKEKDYSTTPFIFFSDHHDNTEALGLGANDWIEIRYSHPDFLLSRIYHHLKTNKHGIQIHRA